MRWLVDGMNVMGSRPDRWWADRRGAITRLAERLSDFAFVTGETVTVVFDSEPFEMQAGVDVLFAPGGPDAADDKIVAIVSTRSEPSSERVVTSDRRLARRVEQLGAEVMSAGAFLRHLDASTPK
jgi:predicted RNA-binding protein with PIN domain